MVAVVGRTPIAAIITSFAAVPVGRLMLSVALFVQAHLDRDGSRRQGRATAARRGLAVCAAAFCPSNHPFLGGVALRFFFWRTYSAIAAIAPGASKSATPRLFRTSIGSSPIGEASLLMTITLDIRSTAIAPMVHNIANHFAIEIQIVGRTESPLNYGSLFHLCWYHPLIRRTLRRVERPGQPRARPWT